MQTKIVAGLVVATSFAILGSVFGGCSGDAYLEDPFGTDKPIAVEGGCIYEYENSFTNEGMPYRENAPDGVPCKGNLGSCQSGICVARNDMDASTHEIDGGTDAETPANCDMESAMCAPQPCHDVACDNGTCTQVPQSKGNCEVSTGASGPQNGICFQGECKECIEMDVSKCPTPNNAYCENFDCRVCSESDCGKGTCGSCPGEQCKPSAAGCANDRPCVDGVCCENPCKGTCMTCNNKGKCVPVEDGVPDDTCGKPNAFCFDAGNDPSKNKCYLAAGEACNNNNDCMSKECLGGGAFQLCSTGSPSENDYCVDWKDCVPFNCGQNNRCVWPIVPQP